MGNFFNIVIEFWSSDVRKQRLCSDRSFFVITLCNEIHPGGTSFLEVDGIQGGPMLGTVPLQLSSAEELPETAVKAWKRQSMVAVAIIS